MIFGETTQRAHYQYQCDFCSALIIPGERYRRQVWKVAPDRVHVLRRHLECPPEDERLFEELQEPVPLLRAA